MHLVQLSAFSKSALQLKEEKKNIFDHSYIHIHIHIQCLGSHSSKILLTYQEFKLQKNCIINSALQKVFGAS